MPFDGTTSPVTQALLDGRDRVAKGWCQGQMRRYGAVCMVGGLYDACWMPEQRARGIALLERAISDLNLGIGQVVAFNDALGRTQHEVLAVYDRAIELSMR